MTVIKQYRDPLYGFVELDEVEQAIVETPEFQRLRRINQLGTTFLVYPSACHTRFEHSIGVLHAITAMLNALREPLLDQFQWSEEEFREYRMIARLAALTHDLGHAPFSHASEEVFPEVGGERLKHEHFSFLAITRTQIAGIIDKALGEGTAVRVANIATESPVGVKEVFITELLAGDFGADRVDYLMRDSYHLGVQYGRFDLHRLLNTLLVRHNADKQSLELAVEGGGLHTVEAFLLARYFMFLEVYYHKTRRILDRHLGEFLSEYLPGGSFPADLNEYLSWDDPRVLEGLRGRQATLAAKRLMGRLHHRLAWESQDHPEPQVLVGFDWLKKELVAEFGAEALRFDEATKSPYSFQRPPIFVWDGKAFIDLKEKSPLVRHLLTIEKCRVYSTPERREAVKAATEEHWVKVDRRKRRP